MNYYEHHIRDYDAATSHLTWDEDMAYSRLLRWYYRRERPIPAELSEACRQVRAVSKAQRDAVESVLREFFVLEADGWHQSTCDEAIADFKAGEPEREVKKANEDNRLKRHRIERAELFKRLTDAGYHAAWNIGIVELRALVKSHSETPPATPHTPPETPPATAPATPATATQTPDTSTQTPVVRKDKSARTTLNEDARADDLDPVVELRMAFVRGGFPAASLNASDPRLMAMAEQGVDPQEVEDATRDAVKSGKGFGWIVAAINGRRADAAALALAPRSNGPPSRKEVQLSTAAILTGATRRNPSNDPETIDVDSRIVTPAKLA